MCSLVGKIVKKMFWTDTTLCTKHGVHLKRRQESCVPKPLGALASGLYVNNAALQQQQQQKQQQWLSTAGARRSAAGTVNERDCGGGGGDDSKVTEANVGAKKFLRLQCSS